MRGARPVRATRGTEMSCRSWGAEAALRMLQNNLDPEVAERPDDLVVYGGNGRAARSWEAFDAIVHSLRTMAPDDTLLVQSGKPVGVVRTHEGAPRVLIANSLLVPRWATPEHFRELEDKGLMMYGQMTAGSWIYIGTQGILQGTYATFTEVANQHFGGTLAGAASARARLPGRDRRLAGRRHRPGRGGQAGPQGAVGGRGRELCRRAARAGVPWLGPGRGDRPDLGPRRAQRVRAARHVVGGGAGAAVDQAVGVRRPFPRVDDGALPGDGRPDACRGSGLRLRQRAARPGAGHGLRRRVRLPGLRAGLHPAVVRPGGRPVPVGLPVGVRGRPGGDRRGRAQG